MDFDSVSYTRNDDNTYGQTSQNHYFKPVIYHSRTASPNFHKSKWCIREPQQFYIFKIADESEWICNSNSCLFSIINDCQVIIGTENERIAKFPKPLNTTDPWHGFPTNSTKDIISENLLDKWEEKDVISPSTRRRIVRGAI